MGTRSRREKTRMGGVRKHAVSRWWLFGGGGCFGGDVLVATDPLSGSLSLPLLLSISRFGYGVIFLVFIVFKRNNYVWLS